MVVSVPVELNQDHSLVLEVAQQSGGQATVAGLVDALRWPNERAERALDRLLKEGMAWVDDKAGTSRVYWFLSMWLQVRIQEGQVVSL
mmetsp:Transcript_54526/g.74523  ORF Transcript_54526/g.74523 Transcript_54526/m.74523 type:complete len:88 (-) Transcript_54526:136-399(-)